MLLDSNLVCSHPTILENFHYSQTYFHFHMNKLKNKIIMI